MNLQWIFECSEVFSARSCAKANIYMVRSTLPYSFMQISTWAKVGLYLDMFLLHMFERVKWSEADTKNPVRLSSKAHSALKDENQEGMYCDVRTGGKMTNRVEKMTFFQTFRNCRNIHFRWIWDAFLNVLRCFRRAAAQKQIRIWCEALSLAALCKFRPEQK